MDLTPAFLFSLVGWVLHDLYIVLLTTVTDQGCAGHVTGFAS